MATTTPQKNTHTPSDTHTHTLIGTRWEPQKAEGTCQLLTTAGAPRKARSTADGLGVLAQNAAKVSALITEDYIYICLSTAAAAARMRSTAQHETSTRCCCCPAYPQCTVGILSGSLPHCPAGNLEDYLFYFFAKLSILWR